MSRLTQQGGLAERQRVEAATAAAAAKERQLQARRLSPGKAPPTQNPLLPSVPSAPLCAWYSPAPSPLVAHFSSLPPEPVPAAHTSAVSVSGTYVKENPRWAGL